MRFESDRGNRNRSRAPELSATDDGIGSSQITVGTRGFHKRALSFAFSGGFERYRDVSPTDDNFLNYNHRIVDINLKVVTHLPLRELWRADGFSTTARGKSLTPDDVREFLTSGPVQFVVADVGVAPRWIPASECFDFWKREAKPHLETSLIGI